MCLNFGVVFRPHMKKRNQIVQVGLSHFELILNLCINFIFQFFWKSKMPIVTLFSVFDAVAATHVRILHFVVFDFRQIVQYTRNIFKYRVFFLTLWNFSLIYEIFSTSYQSFAIQTFFLLISISLWKISLFAYGPKSTKSRHEFRP